MLRLSESSSGCGTIFTLRATLILLGVLLSCGCSKPLSSNECESLLMRYVALLAASDRPETSSAERAHMLEMAKQKAARDPQFGRCGKSVSRAQFDCAMVAPSTDDFERCLM
jgi:hypothetical protein